MGSFLTWSKYMFRFRIYSLLYRMLFQFIALSLAILLLGGVVYYVRGHLNSLVPRSFASYLPRNTSLVYAHRSVPDRSGNTENFYSPNNNLEEIDYNDIEHAQGHLDIAMYGFTDRRIAALLIRRADAGLLTRIYRDGEQFQDEEKRDNSTSSMFHGHPNIHIRVKPPSRYKLMHLKAYSDGIILRDGSANWSLAGLKEQDNNARYTNDPQQIKDFENDFENMWKRSDNIVVQ